MTTVSLWIGLSDAETEGTWLWGDGSPLNYDGWVTGQPDGGLAENQALVAENSSAWADANENFVAGGYLFEFVGLNPNESDSDGDGLNDGEEINTVGSSPVAADTDGDGLSDGDEVNTHGSSPILGDTDSDGLGDYAEVTVHGSNPSLADTDGDGFDDKFEVDTGFDPASGASTPDTLSSIRTSVEFRFNAANGATYRVEASTDLENWTIVEDGIAGNGGVIVRFYSTEGKPVRSFRARRN